MAPYALEACYIHCCPIIKLYTYHVDNYKESFIFFYKEGYVFQKIIQFTVVVGYTFFSKEILLSVTYMPIFKFQNMANTY
jgi:hypothetical protein